MAGTWKCDRCSAANDERSIRCFSCGLMRGSVVVATEAPPATDTTVPTSAAAGSDAPIAGWVDPSAATTAAAAIPFWRRLPIGWLIVIVVVAAGGIGGALFNAARSPTGEIVKQGDLTITDLRVGDCYDLQDATADVVEKVTAIPCTSEHQYELYFVGSMPYGAFPTEEAFDAFLADECLPAFEAFVGTAYASSTLDIFWFTPTLAGWNTGDRVIQCAVYDPGADRLTASLRGSNR